MNTPKNKVEHDFKLKNMKKKLFIFSVLLWAGGIGLLSAQTQVVNNICYDEEFTESISVVSDIELSTLTILDRLKFKKKRYIKRHHEYLNSSGNGTHDVHFVSHENMFPKWYTHPSTIRSDETGIKSYFATRSKYLPDGWTGSIKSKTEHGQYVKDKRTGEKYLFQAHSKKASEAYSTWNQKIRSEGFLTKYTFSYPTSSELKILQSQGFEVTTSDNIIRVKNTEIIMVWDIVQKIFIRQFIESNSIMKTLKTYYQYVQEFGTDMIHTIVTTTPETFDNGDCFETISYTVYTNYSQGCAHENVAFRSQYSESQYAEISDLEVFPNPASERLNVIIPNPKVVSTLQISNINGEVLIHRKVSNGQTSFDVNLSEFPAGIYIVKCQQGSDNYSTKFVKQ